MRTRLTVIVPVYNEKATIVELLTRLNVSLPSDCEIIAVDDGSSDGSREILSSLSMERTQVLLRDDNGGKTRALRDALELAQGDYVIVQDADLEYNPQDIPKLLEHAEEHHCVVYGKRPSHFDRPRRWLFAGGVLAVDILLLLVNRRWIRDHATCYKMVPRATLNRLNLESTGFEGCIEITSKLLRSGIAIQQLPISYSPRSRAEGKKLTLSYGLRAIRAAWKFRNWLPQTSAPTETRTASNSRSEIQRRTAHS